MLLTLASVHCLRASAHATSTGTCRQFVDVQDFCRNKLGISDARLQYMPWPEVLHRLVRLQRSVKLCLAGELSEHDIVMRIMRRDDYLIGARPQLSVAYTQLRPASDSRTTSESLRMTMCV